MSTHPSTIRRFTGKLIPFALAVTLFASPAVSQAAAFSAVSPVTAVSLSSGAESAADYALFLQDKFGITFDETVAKGDFLEAAAKALRLEASADAAVVFDDVPASSPLYAAAAALHSEGVISGTAVRPSANLTAINAAQIAVKAAGLRELALSYPADKAEQTLAPFGLTVKTLGLQGAQELAAAIDAGLVPAEDYDLIKERKPASGSYAASLLGKTLAIKGQYKRYIGETGDADIYAELLNTYETSGIVKAPVLQEVADKALEAGLITGYTIRDSRYESNFVEPLTITYAHSDIKHALQLIALLRSEGINAKVQYEPRTSAFVYLKEWGEPGESEYYEVRQIDNGNYIEYAKEYELILEFENEADRNRFDGIILQYAKKNEQDQQGLLYGSWWQPLYYATDRPEGDYKQITNNKLSDSRYYVESFSLNEQASDVAAAFSTDEPNIAFSQYTFWTNAAFYRYLNGESK